MDTTLIFSQHIYYLTALDILQQCYTVNSPLTLLHKTIKPQHNSQCSKISYTLLEPLGKTGIRGWNIVKKSKLWNKICPRLLHDKLSCYYAEPAQMTFFFFLKNNYTCENTKFVDVNIVFFP